MRTDRIRIASRLYTKIMHYLTTLTIAGSDCSGGAGIQADIKTLSALGCYAASVITAVTVQNTCGVQSVYPLPAEIVRQQIRAVLSDLKPTAIKIGMLGNYEIARAVSEEIADYKETAQFVLDPIICSIERTPPRHSRYDCMYARHVVPSLYVNHTQSSGNKQVNWNHGHRRNTAPTSS